jgi:23S rRNA (guanine1835-N2)-methyltransferase
MTADDVCVTPFGDFVLRRPLPDRTGSLRAWNGADLLLLDQVAVEFSDAAPGDLRVLIIGDEFGALTVPLERFAPVVLIDSIVAEHCIGTNRALAGHVGQITVVSCLTELSSYAPFDLVVWNVDRVTDVVVSIASSLSNICHAKTVVFAAGMDKHLPPRTADVLRLVGEVTTHPGRRKAHLFEVRVRANEATFATIDGPTAAAIKVQEYDLVLTGGPGVFAAERFDVGTRLLASQLDWLANDRADAVDIVDLGCGNGALGILALRRWPNARILFLDESAAAIDSARNNVIANTGDEGLRRSRFVRSDVFSELLDSKVDLVLCNPPFHHANAMNDEVAWQMFQQSYRRLRSGGELWVVGNRHLGYHDKLRRLFGDVSQLDSHPKFVVLAARRE